MHRMLVVQNSIMINGNTTFSLSAGQEHTRGWRLASGNIIFSLSASGIFLVNAYNQGYANYMFHGDYFPFDPYNFISCKTWSSFLQ